MTRFQIILSPDRNPDAHEILSPPPRRFWRLKAGLAALLMVSAVIELVLAALFLGSIIAALLVILVVIVSMVMAIKALIRHIARIRDDVSMSQPNTERCLPPFLCTHRRKQRNDLSSPPTLSGRRTAHI